MTRQLTEAQKAYVNGGTKQMSKAGLSRAKQILATQRRFIYDRQPPRCIRCLQPRDPHSDPICDHCKPRCHGETAR